MILFADFQEGSMTMRGYTFDFGGELPNITVSNAETGNIGQYS
jgi:hypothetical protein